MLFFSSNPAHGEVYSLQEYVIYFVSDLFSPDPPLSSRSKAYRNDVTEIFLKVAFNTITLSLIFKIFLVDSEHK